jgi:hypothetical protein
LSAQKPLLDSKPSEVRLEALTKADVVVYMPWREPFIVLRQPRPEELYKEYASKVQFDEDYETFRALKLKLLMDPTYRGRWIAVVNGELIGPSDDDSELSRIIDEKYGNAVAYIGRVAEGREILELPPRELE